MDWNFKASSSWDLTGFQQEAVPIDGSDKLTNTGDHVTGSHARCSIDLKLGEVTDSSNETLCSWKQPRVLKAENLHPSGSTKRPRPTANGSQPVSCLVDGCVSDLSNCREYHRRHKVCEAHSKTSQVSIGGQTQRFCQQCSRFHSLDKFDEVKRSCRKRLDGHNRRRRKPQPDPLFRSVNSLSYSQGTPLFPFSSPHVYPSAAVVNPTWSAVSEADAGRYNSLNQHMHFPDKQFPFFQGDNPILNNQTSHETTICQSITLSPSVDAGRRIQVQDTDCALSLLSAKPTHSTIPGNQTKQHPDNSIHWMNPPNQNVHGHSLGPIDSLLVSSSRDAGDDVQGSSGMFVVGSSSYSSGTKADQTLPFSWE